MAGRRERRVDACIERPDVRAGSEIEVRVELWIVIRLRAEIFPAKAQIQREARIELPSVLGIQRRFMVAMAAVLKFGGPTGRVIVQSGVCTPPMQGNFPWGLMAA